MARVDLRQYIESANPSPVFTIASDPNDLGAQINQQYILTYELPNNITNDTIYTLSIDATNSAGTASKSIVVRNIASAVPRVLPIDHQEITSTETFTLNLNDYVTGTHPITIAYATNYVAPTGMSLTDGTLTYTPSGITQDTSEAVHLVFSNSLGSESVTLTINIRVVSIPEWDEEEINLEVVEGDEDQFDLNRYVSGHPDPNIHFAQGFFQGDLTLVLNDGILQIIATPVIDIDTTYPLMMSATNSAGSANKTINLRVLSRLQLEEPTEFTSDDYNEVRYLLGLEITATELPNNVIASDIYRKAAQDWVSQQVPYDPAKRRTKANLRRKKRAVIYRCASLLAGHVPELLSESIGGSSKSFGNTDWIDRQSDLGFKARREIDLIKLDEDGTTEFRLFSTTNGGY